MFRVLGVYNFGRIINKSNFIESNRCVLATVFKGQFKNLSHYEMIDRLIWHAQKTIKSIPAWGRHISCVLSMAISFCHSLTKRADSRTVLSNTAVLTDKGNTIWSRQRP